MTGHAGTRGQFRFVRHRGHRVRLCVRRVADRRRQVGIVRNRRVGIARHRQGLNLRAEIARNRREVVAIDPRRQVVVIDRSRRVGVAIDPSRQVVATGRNLRVAAVIVHLRRVATTTGRNRARGLRLARIRRTTTETIITTATEFGRVNTYAAPRCFEHRGAVVFRRRL